MSDMDTLPQDRRRDGDEAPAAAPEPDGAAAATDGGSRRDEQAVALSEIILRATLDSIDSGILVIDGLGTVLTANRRFEELFCVPHELTVSGRSQTLLTLVRSQLTEPDEFARAVVGVDDSAAGGQGHLHFKDGRMYERYTRAIVIDKRPARFLSFVDITERSRAEREL